MQNTNKILNDAIYGHTTAKNHILQLVSKWIRNPESNGNILAILCSICFACVFIISEQVRRVDSALSFSRSIFFYASITLLIIELLVTNAVFK